MKIHLIFNAHLDPIWLWPWQSSLDEMLATCRSACDRLDAHPDLLFSRGEAWVYRQIERLDPALFRRIAHLIQKGRWEIAGGWWIQPDCNLPSGFAFARQIDEGRKYFLDRFGCFPEYGYNVDSFGHAATLPALMRAAGQRYYVMMRPQESEMPLPARLFRWNGHEGGPEVTVFRIAGSYLSREMGFEHFRASVEGLPPGINDTMCFLGVGDHGGGPTERQIAWLRKHWHDFPGHTLEFSTPSRYFEAIQQHQATLPLVTGELQQHAIGCYSVHRPMKTALRRAEHLLDQAERLREKIPTPERLFLPDLGESWRRAAFHQFHDTLGGTCVPNAYVQVLDQLGGGSGTADEVLQIGFRQLLSSVKENTLQRIAIHNPSTVDFDGYAQCEPWREWKTWTAENHLLDDEGRVVPSQRILSDAAMDGMGAVLFPVRVKAGTTALLRIAETGSAAIPSGVTASSTALENNRGLSVTLGSSWRLGFGSGVETLHPSLQLIEDGTDTWSHSTDRYGAAVAEAEWKEPVLIENGPLRAALSQNGKIGESRLSAEWRLHADSDYAELLLRVFWAERHKLLKLTLPLPWSAEERLDGIMGGSLVRRNDGRELPLRDWTQIGSGSRTIGVVAPDVFALDVTSTHARLTLLRSPLLAHHLPHPPLHPRGVYADQGEHEFRFRFSLGAADPQRLERHALHWQQPLLFADVTRGMPGRFGL